MVNGVSLIVYPAADLSKAKAFFRELFGSDPTRRASITSATKLAIRRLGSIQRAAITVPGRYHSGT